MLGGSGAGRLSGERIVQYLDGTAFIGVKSDIALLLKCLQLMFDR